MLEPTFYRGSVCGTPIHLTVSGFPVPAGANLCASLPFANFHPAPPNPPAANPIAAAAFNIHLTMAAAEQTGTPALPTPPAPIHRALSAEIDFHFDPDRRDVHFRIAHHAPPQFWQERIRSEILHLFGLFTPALALHASSVLTASGRQAWVFCGPSGAGKTTISTRLLKDHVLVDEEIVLVDLQTAPGQILNAPAGHAPTAPLPIAGLFQLKQAPACTRTKISPGEFIAKNMTRPFDLNLPQFLTDRLEKLARLTESLSPQELHFNLRPDDLHALLLQ